MKLPQNIQTYLSLTYQEHGWLHHSSALSHVTISWRWQMIHHLSRRTQQEHHACPDSSCQVQFITLKLNTVSNKINGIWHYCTIYTCTLMKLRYTQCPKNSNTPCFKYASFSLKSWWISMKYCTLHYLNITYCHTYYDVHILPCMLIL